ncbi:MAG: hypothetical protein NTX86_05600 [Candidatus Dependentiae bacterium]|nr:hypothetical protein [Candidatus Dependentiae bacterium]
MSKAFFALLLFFSSVRSSQTNTFFIEYSVEPEICYIERSPYDHEFNRLAESADHMLFDIADEMVHFIAKFPPEYRYYCQDLLIDMQVMLNGASSLWQDYITDYYDAYGPYTLSQLQRINPALKRLGETLYRFRGNFKIGINTYRNALININDALDHMIYQLTSYPTFDSIQEILDVINDVTNNLRRIS